MKKIIAIILALLMMLSLVACFGGGDNNTDPNNGTDNSGDQSSNGEKTTPTSLKINGADVSEYTIIYAYNPARETYSRYSSLITQDTEYDKQTAENLAALFKEHFGATVSVKRDGEKTVGGKEIIIGSTDRGLVDNVMGTFTTVKDYNVRETNGNIVICGASFGATWHAAEDLVADLLSQDAETAKIDSGYSLNAKANMLVVGCIGDSLTNGSKPSNYTSSTVPDSIRRDIVAYPAVLQRIAWKDMVVYNYGQGGRTMITNFVWTDGSGNHGWTSSMYYDACMQNAPNIDLALIMLGTNDSNKTRAEDAGYNFGTQAYKKVFIDSCADIVNQLKAKNSKMRIALLNCPASYHSFESDMLTYIRPYQKAAAQQLGLDHLDMYKATMLNTTNSDYPDGLHPNDAGYTKYAEIIYDLTKPIVKEMLGK